MLMDELTVAAGVENGGKLMLLGGQGWYLNEVLTSYFEVEEKVSSLGPSVMAGLWEAG